jgi:MYXO-CTERM domain-containing protein
MRPIARNLVALVACSWCLLAVPARADVAPPDICQGEGTVCDNAGPAGTLPGICTASKCSSPEPKPDGGVIIRDCLRCLPSSGGAGGAGGAGEAGAGGAGTAGAATGGTDDDSGCNCRLSSASAERTIAGSMLLVGLVALRASRRRSLGSSKRATRGR